MKLWTVCLLTVLGLTPRSLFAQSPDDGASAPTPLSNFVPATAGLYVSVRDLAEVNEVLHRVHAWDWLPPVLGLDAGNTVPTDLQEAAAAMMGATTFFSERELQRTEIGIVASSVADLNRAVWLLRVPRGGSVDRWFPVERRTAQADFGAARSFRMDDGLVVCQRDGVVALAREPEGDPVVLSTMYLMRGRPGTVLHELPAIQRARGYLPVRPLATVYVLNRTAPSVTNDASAPTARSESESATTAMVAALYEADGGLDIAISGVSEPATATSGIDAATIERLLQLPRSTLFAAARAIEFSKMSSTVGAMPGGVLGQYLSFLFGVPGSGDAQRVYNLIGPNVIFAWDQNFQKGGLAPQFAVLIQTATSGLADLELRKAAGRVVDLVRVIDSAAAAQALKVEESIHLGETIACLPLNRWAANSTRPFADLMSNVEPCWTVSGGWLIATLGRDHLERILDAHRGLAPSLGAIREASALRTRRADVRFAAILQGETASEVLDDWLAGAKDGGSLLAADWWAELNGTVRQGQRRVGIGMRVEQQPGTVVVGRVYADSAADGLLLEGDRVVAVDGVVLAIENPNADLRSRIENSQARPGPTLRIERDGTMHDVVLPMRRVAPSPTALGMAPVDAVRELASVVRSIPFASLVVSAADERHYAARLSLRFASEAAVTQIPPE